jgi:hypothetical protein|tara:strand:+ start:58 stop:177 length:120 start_codon:yes stop_codon:yes gene_type:complete
MIGTIVVNADSIRLFVVMIMGGVWFYLLNEYIREGDNDE